SLWSAQPPVVGGTPPLPNCKSDSPAQLAALFPDRLSAGNAIDLLIVGCGFANSTQVKFNGTQHQALFVDANHIRMGLSAADVSGSGSAVVTLSDGKSDFGTGTLGIITATLQWPVLIFRSVPISSEVQLLLMVLFTGAFGSSVPALRSLANYRGDGRLYQTWSTFYVIQPFQGAGIAFLLYLVIRGGFLAGAGVDAKSVNQFSMCAFAGLAGAFSDTAFLKLRE